MAAFGIPHPELGEQLIAVVELLDPSLAGGKTATELLDWCAKDLARQKIPRRIEFTDQFPRADNGKLYKRGLIEQYTT